MNKETAEILVALAYMWEQYCSPPFTHQYMTAGEEAEIVLQKYNLLKGDLIDQDKLEELEKIAKS